MKIITILVVCFFFTACQDDEGHGLCEMIAQDGGNSSTACPQKEEIGPLSPGDITPVDLSREPVSPLAKSWEAQVYFANFNPTQEAKVEEALSLMKKVLSSKEFRERVVTYTYQGKDTYIDNAGMNNWQIYQLILNGAERMGNTSKNNCLDVELELYTEATTTIGYTFPHTTRIWMNTKYFDRYTPVQVAGNLMHEWMHKLGFNHATTWSKSRDSSVPYAIGYLMEELARKQQAP